MFIVGICFLFVFLWRDAQLLASARHATSRSSLHIYCLAIAAWIVSAGLLNVSTTAEIVAKLKSPWVWSISIGLHVAGIVLCVFMRRTRRVSLAWLAALFPSPVMILLLLGISLQLPSPMFGGGRIIPAVVTALGWTIAVGVSGELIARTGSGESEFAMDFAVMANSTAVVLLPLGPFF